MGRQAPATVHWYAMEVVPAPCRGSLAWFFKRSLFRACSHAFGEAGTQLWLSLTLEPVSWAGYRLLCVEWGLGLSFGLPRLWPLGVSGFSYEGDP